MNTVNRRLRTIRIIEKMHKQPEVGRKLGLKDVSEFKEESHTSNREPQTDQ